MCPVSADGKEVNLIAPEGLKTLDYCALRQLRKQIPTSLERNSHACANPVMYDFSARGRQGAVDSHLKSAPIFLEEP